MSRLYALSSSQALQLISSLQGTFSPTPDPAGSLYVDFDEATNPNLAADIMSNWNSYTVPATGTLNKNGVGVPVNAPSALYSLQSTILNGASDATLKAAIVALWNGTATAQQQQRALAYCLLKLHQAGTI